MNLSFYINRNDLQELQYLLSNSVILGNKSVDIKAVAVECFNSIEKVKEVLGSFPILPSEKYLISNYILVSIRYDQYELIKEYLLWQ